jgi:two-component system chemotaxis response regulator CheB
MTSMPEGRFVLPSRHERGAPTTDPAVPTDVPCRRVVAVVAASAGGIEALRAVLAGLTADHEGLLLVVLHIGSRSGTALPRILDRAGPLRAAAAQDGERLLGGRVYVCVPDRHLVISNGHVRVRRGPREHGHRPAADPLLRSAAAYFGPRAVGVILSGTLSDGTAGLQAIREHGGVAIVQDPDDASFDGMPRSAIEVVGADHVVPAADIGSLIERYAHEPAPDAGTASPSCGASNDHRRRRTSSA